MKLTMHTESPADTIISSTSTKSITRCPHYKTVWDTKELRFVVRWTAGTTQRERAYISCDNALRFYNRIEIDGFADPTNDPTDPKETN